MPKGFVFVDLYQSSPIQNGLQKDKYVLIERYAVTCQNPICMGKYDFDQIAHFAKKRFVEGYNTVALMEQAESEREKEEIALVCLLDVEDDKIRDLQLCCSHSHMCEVIDCRDKLKEIIEQELDQQAPGL